MMDAMAGPKPKCLCDSCKTCKNREKGRLYRQHHRAELNAYARQRRVEQGDRIRQLDNIRREENKERYNSYHRGLRAAKREQGILPAEDRAKYLKKKEKSDWLLKNRERGATYRSNHPEAAKAHQLVSAAVRRGKLSPGPCEICGAKADAHHDDYSKPLDVRWLCRAHHLEHHRKLRGLALS